MPQLAMPLFSVDLTNDTTGTYTFGAIDNTRFTGSLTSVPVNAASGFWQVTSSSFQVGTQTIVNQGASPAIAGKFAIPIEMGLYIYTFLLTDFYQ